MDREELAWAAGFFDGEGNVSLKRDQSRPRLCLQISQSGDPTVLERFQRAVGGLGSINGPYLFPSTLPGRRPIWRFNTNKFESVQAIAALLWNFLSAPKRAQVSAALSAVRGGI